MRQLTCTVAIMLLAGGIALAEPSAQTFEGEYKWKDGGSDYLSATFTPKDEGWKVAFNFEWSGKKYTWNGQASGDLSEGSRVTGTASGQGGRTWEFEGTVKDGVFRGTHTEITGGDRYETGGFTLKR